MAHSELKATITYNQEQKIREELDTRDVSDRPDLKRLKDDPDLVADLSAQEASELIKSLSGNTRQRRRSIEGKAAPTKRKEKPANDTPGSITDKQRPFLSTLLEKTREHDTDWFKKLKAEPDLIFDLSSKEAGMYIGVLRRLDEETPTVVRPHPGNRTKD